MLAADARERGLARPRIAFDPRTWHRFPCLTAFDRHLERWVVHHRTSGLNWLFEALSRAGTFGAIWILIAFLLALAWRRWGVFVVTAASVAVADLAATALKAVVDVQRPSSRYAAPKTLVPAPHDHSFPSGHTATSFAAATVLTAFAPRLAPLWLLLAVAIGFARVYVGVHYPLDIAGGAAVGVLTALLLLAVTRRRSRAGTQSTR